MISRLLGSDHSAIPSADRRLLLLACLVLWAMAYASINLGLITDPIDHPAERMLRRVLTCGAGLLLCLTMTPLLWRARTHSVPRQIGLALGLSALAYLVHFLVRVGVFHLYRPVWGPLDLEGALIGLRADGWMFPLWAALCLLVFGRMRGRMDAGPISTSEAPAIWSADGRWRVRIPLETVLLFEAERDYVRLYTASKRYLVRGRLKELAANLPADRYLQVHRSAIVQLAAIEGLRKDGSTWRLRLPGGVETRVSRAMGTTLRRKLGDGIARDETEPGVLA